MVSIPARVNSPWGQSLTVVQFADDVCAAPIQIGLVRFASVPSNGGRSQRLRSALLSVPSPIFLSPGVSIFAGFCRLCSSVVEVSRCAFARSVMDLPLAQFVQITSPAEIEISVFSFQNLIQRERQRERERERERGGGGRGRQKGENG